METTDKNKINKITHCFERKASTYPTPQPAKGECLGEGFVKIFIKSVTIKGQKTGTKDDCLIKTR